MLDDAPFPPILKFLDFYHIGLDLLHLKLRLTDFLYEICLNKLSKMDNSESSNLNLRPNLRIFFDFLEFKCKISNPWYTSENKIKLRNFNGNERIRIFEVLFQNNKNIKLGQALTDYQKSMCGLFGPNPQRIRLGQNDHFDWRLEFFVWHKFFRIYKLLVNFDIRPILEKEIFFDKLKTDLKNWLDSYLQINKTYRNSKTITPYIHNFVFHSIELLQIHGKIFNLLNCNGLEKLNHFTITYYHSCSNKNKTDLNYLNQMILKRNRYEFIRLEEFNFDELHFDDDENDYYDDYDNDALRDISLKIKMNKYFL